MAEEIKKKTFPCRIVLKEKNNFTNETYHCCDECNRLFKNKLDLNRHKNMHHKIQEAKCIVMSEEIKKKTFPCRIVLKEKNNFTNETYHCCDECNRLFKNKLDLNRHKNMHHKIQEAEDSKMDTDTDDELSDKPESNELSSSDEDELSEGEDNKKRLSCDECKKTFRYLSDLTAHARSHTGERPFVCEICDQSFTQNSHLTRHKAIHKRAKKTFKCKVCKKAFRLKFYLDQHVRTHNDKKPFACDECDARFSQKSHLNTHKKSHLGIREFVCEICSKDFVLKYHLKEHMKRVHNKK